MKILLMADLLPNPDSGAAGTEYQTIQALRGLGHSVDTVWAQELPRRIQHGNLHYLIELPIVYRRVMLSRLKTANYDIVHVNQPHGYLAAKALRSQHTNTAFIHRSHGLELRVERDLKNWKKQYPAQSRDIGSRLKQPIQKVMARLLAHNSCCIARYADGHIVSANDCADFLRHEMGVPPERIAVIPQAAPVAYLTSPASPMTQQRSRRLLYVGQHAFFKAPMVVAEVINRIVERHPDVAVTWVASKCAHPQIYQLLTPVARARLSLHDWMPQDELIQIYDSHGVFLFPSFVEGFGKVFMEAMARGLCVVAANNSGAKDVIRHGNDGMLVPTGDIEATSRTCLKLLQSEQLRVAISRSAAARAREYTWSRVATETAAFYQTRLEAAKNQLS
jgi:glycosyltransferase involved in cell wall biosynthesis